MPTGVKAARGKRYRPLKKVARLAVISSLALCLPMACTRPESDRNRIVYAFWGSVQQQKAEEEIIGAFEEAHPEIHVETLPVGSRFVDKIQAMLVGGVAPDVMMVTNDFYYDWAVRGALADLTNEMQTLREEGEVMPTALRATAWNQRVYALPVNAHGWVTYVNQTALRKAGIAIPESGLTWDFILSVAPQLASREGHPDAPTEFAMFAPDAVTIFWQCGARLFDDLAHPTKVTINSPEALKALELVRTLHANPLVVPAEVSKDEGTYQLFKDGRVAFFFNGRWISPELIGRTDFEWDILPYPGMEGSNLTVHDFTGLAVWSKSPRQEAARKFVQFYASRAGAALAMGHMRNVPVFREDAYGKDFLSLRPPSSMRHYSATMEEGASLNFVYTPGVARVKRLFQNRMQQALAEPDLPSELIIQGLEADLRRWLKEMKEAGILN
ncbi:MAG TPA: sugar ABC transporter substrate-binding protein [Chthoniobacteraceae bacterium]|nr:sugar ABC transporter substrate-binding protein [Chthoniobacteraceae bacterium]